MIVEPTEIAEVLVLCPKRFGDDRGWFVETWNADRMKDAGIDLPWVQDNHSMSAKAGTLRGLHFQVPPRAQDKLVRCTRGRILDVAVDIRKGSPTYGKWVGVELSADNGKQLFIPKGFAHGFVTREDNCEVQYKCTDTYAPIQDGAIRWNDPDISLEWGLETDPILSAKDAVAPLLAEFDSPFVWERRI